MKELKHEFSDILSTLCRCMNFKTHNETVTKTNSYGQSISGKGYQRLKCTCVKYHRQYGIGMVILLPSQSPYANEVTTRCNSNTILIYLGIGRVISVSTCKVLIPSQFPYQRGSGWYLTPVTMVIIFLFFLRVPSHRHLMEVYRSLDLSFLCIQFWSI